MSAEEPRCARCGCIRREHHKLHCEGRDGNCMCSGGWADPGTRLTAVDEAFQAENAEYDAAFALPDACRVVGVPTPSGAMPVRIHGGVEPSEEGRSALGELVAAAAKRSAVDNPHGAVIQELMLAWTHGRGWIKDGPTRDRLGAAIRAARDALRGGTS